MLDGPYHTHHEHHSQWWRRHSASSKKRNVVAAAQQPRPVHGRAYKRRHVARVHGRYARERRLPAMYACVASRGTRWRVWRISLQLLNGRRRLVVLQRQGRNITHSMVVRVRRQAVEARERNARRRAATSAGSAQEARQGRSDESKTTTVRVKRRRSTPAKAGNSPLARCARGRWW